MVLASAWLALARPLSRKTSFHSSTNLWLFQYFLLRQLQQLNSWEKSIRCRSEPGRDKGTILCRNHLIIWGIGNNRDDVMAKWLYYLGYWQILPLRSLHQSKVESFNSWDQSHSKEQKVGSEGRVRLPKRMIFRKSSKCPPPSFSESYVADFATKLWQKCVSSLWRDYCVLYDPISHELCM